MPHVHVPSSTAEMPGIAQCDDAPPPWGPIRTPDELASMFLIETERGCSRGCTYCVMRRSTNGGMRIVPKARVLELVPEDAKRVGLVGAAVSDHPHITQIVQELADSGREVGLSSLRPDRLKDEFVEVLKLAGYKTLTTALDGTSERLRDLIERRGREPHYQQAAERARKYGMDCLKLYLMVGLPGETDADIDECVKFVTELSGHPVALGIAPFCPKRNTRSRWPVRRHRWSTSLKRLRQGSRGQRTWGPPSAGGRGSSRCWRWAARRRGRAVRDAVTPAFAACQRLLGPAAAARAAARARRRSPPRSAPGWRWRAREVGRPLHRPMPPPQVAHAELERIRSIPSSSRHRPRWEAAEARRLRPRVPVVSSRAQGV